MSNGLGLQEWDAETYAEKTAFVAQLTDAVWQLLDPQPGEYILDLGCGDGRLTLQLQNAGCRVKGIDASADMVASAKAKGLSVELADAQVFDLNDKFDAVFSNAALHWMPEPNAVIDRVVQHLKPGGRFVAEFGGFGNIAAISTAITAASEKFGGDPDVMFPSFYPTEQSYAARLEKAGLIVEKIERAGRLTPLESGMRGWLLSIRKPFLDQFDPDTCEKVIAYIERMLAPRLQDENGTWFADYVRLRFCATLPA